jgi:DNA-binding MarR family transcriptional regulator
MELEALLDLLDDLSIDVVSMTALALAEGGRERDLTLGQWRTLVLIASAPDGARASDLAPRAGMSRPSMSRLIRRLERKGLIAATSDPTDGRAAILTASTLGHRTLDDTRARRRRMMAEALARHGRPLPHALEAGLRAIVAALDERI